MGKRKSSYAWTDKKTGYIYARVQVKEPNGKFKSIYRRALNATHAEQLADEIKLEYENRGQAYLDGRTMTFADLAKWYKKEFVIEAVYSKGKKIDGMRTWKSERQKIDRIAKELGPLLVGEIDEADLRKYRRKRLKSVEIATVNREMESIRAMMRKAVKKKWRKEHIDFDGLIDKSLETRRTVTITAEDESRLLDAARGYAGSPRIYALIIALRDSGARPNELYPVNDHASDYSGEAQTFFEPIRWRDVFDGEKIKDISQLVSYKGKQREVRYCVITERLKSALLELWEFLETSKTIEKHDAGLDNLIFPHTSFKKAWDVVRKEAGLPAPRLRDLRRDWVTRLATFRLFRQARPARGRPQDAADEFRIHRVRHGGRAPGKSDAGRRQLDRRRGRGQLINPGRLGTPAKVMPAGFPNICRGCNIFEYDQSSASTS